VIAYDYEMAAKNLSVDLAAALRRARGRKPRTMRQFCEQELIVPNGPDPGRFKIDTQPILKLWFEELDKDWYVEHVFSGPSQSGKSLFGYVIPTLYYIAEMNESVVFGTPNDSMANDKWQADLMPTMMASPFLRSILPTSGSGSSGGEVRELVKFAHGPLLKIAAAGGSDQGKAGFTSRVLVITEAAGFSEGTETSEEADPLRQLRARLASFDYLQRRIFIEGTKQVETNLPYTLRAQSTKSKIMAQCPHCGDAICPGRDSLVGWQDARDELEIEEKASWACPACGEFISDQLRREILCDAVLVHEGQSLDKRGRVVGPQPRTRRLWFDYGAWHNCFLSAATVAKECWNAQQLEPTTPQRMSADKSVTQFTFGEIYVPPQLHDTDLAEASTVEKRRLDLPRNVLPADTIFWTVGVDMGKRYGHYVCTAFRKNGGVHVCDYGTFDVLLEQTQLDQAFRQALDKLNRALSAGMVNPDGERILMKAGFCDRGYVPAAVVKFASTTDGLWMPVIGRGETQLNKSKYAHPKRKTQTIRKLDPDGRFYVERIHQPARTLQCYVDADAYKRLVGQLLADTPTSDDVEDISFSLFSGVAAVHNKFCRQLCSEQEIVIEMAGQQSKREWIQQGANHYLDAFCYSLAAGNWMGFRWVASEAT
jgi:phage terminase large subunit GpA-like protein